MAIALKRGVLPVEAAGGTGPATLVALSRAATLPRDELAPELAAALDDVGDTAGETWLNLLGVALDAGAPHTAGRLRTALARLEGVELRRHLLGRYAWSWVTLVGAETIDAAAAGDADAFPVLLAHPRYYAGRAADALTKLLPLDPEETRRRLLRAVDAGLAHLDAPRRSETLAAAVRDAARSIAELGDADAVEQVTGGYRYVPEPEAVHVLLVPHLEPEPWLVLAQHRETRLIVYRAHAEPDARERLALLGRALSDPKRVEILALLGRGTRRITELMHATGLARSTVHHHLAQLREAGLVRFEGNARAYRYTPRAEAAAEAETLLAGVLGSRR